MEQFSHLKNSWQSYPLEAGEKEDGKKCKVVPIVCVGRGGQGTQEWAGSGWRLAGYNYPAFTDAFLVTQKWENLNWSPKWILLQPNDVMF